MISQHSIEEIKDIPIYDVVSRYVPDLKKAGATWKAKSPWSNEKTASFYVVPSKNIYKDFSTGNGGSGIDFVMKFGQGCSFVDAIKDIAAKCNVRIEYDEKPTEEVKAQLEEKELMYTLIQTAANSYHAELKKYVTLDPDAQDIQAGEKEPSAIYKELVVKRKFTADTLLQWQIGFAPGDTQGFAPARWRFITDKMGDKNRQHAIDVGLIVNKPDKGLTYDTFRNRIMFPIHNHHGRIVGFGGRTMQKDEYNAKYINSADSVVYHKETVLFGLHFATKAIRDCGYAYLMEGYTDVLSFHQAGYACSVGTCGTALTEHQCKLLRRYTDHVVLFRDGDEAGQKATLRDIDLLIVHGFHVSVVPMPEVDGKEKIDPDELTRLFVSNSVVPAKEEETPAGFYTKEEMKTNELVKKQVKTLSTKKKALTKNKK